MLVAWVSLLVGLGSASTTVRPIQPDLFIPRNAPDVVWVTEADNTVVPIAAPEVAGDTLRGMRRGTSEPVAIPLASMQSVKAKVPDHTKTAVFLVGMGSLATATVYAIWVSEAGRTLKAWTAASTIRRTKDRAVRLARTADRRAPVLRRGAML
jgi:hypothetical protein